MYLCLVTLSRIIYVSMSSDIVQDYLCLVILSRIIYVSMSSDLSSYPGLFMYLCLVISSRIIYVSMSTWADPEGGDRGC